MVASRTIGQRCLSGNTLASGFDLNYFVEFTTFGINGNPIQMAPQWHLASDRASGPSMNSCHGPFLGLDRSPLMNALIVEFAFRNVSGGATGWQCSDFKGNPPKIAGWAFAAGQSIRKSIWILLMTPFLEDQCRK